MTDHSPRLSAEPYAYQSPYAQASTRRPGRTNKTQLKLFEAALLIMSEKGSIATTVDEVAERAGVSKGTVYYNFGSKKTMVDQLLQYGAKLLISEIDKGCTQRDPREAIRLACYSAFKYLEVHPGFARLWLSEVWKNPETWSPTMREVRQELIGAIKGIIDGIPLHYKVDTNQSTEAVAVALFGAVFMLTMDREVHASDRDAEDATRTAMLVIDGYISS
ncbi:TetR/AcrR family transcriptional regulator [Rothia terrae]|uniref:TetR/AcrR family transcriptional regulator n=1 Tax=Rothia terrae TaxID=396015 RepID=UPI0014489999|nr:TetR/AcrR family transcriptional regulator [Rothia terrae]NKZ34233.1 TetR/AcrR family transcriptional regulator [Rothia terrae]